MFVCVQAWPLPAWPGLSDFVNCREIHCGLRTAGYCSVKPHNLLLSELFFPEISSPNKEKKLDKIIFWFLSSTTILR